jgi:ABC-type antimicrobial peptide transport system permease subunit
LDPSLTLVTAALPSFAASAVEFVEAMTIVLAVGVTRGWRAPLIGTLAALLTLSSIGKRVREIGTLKALGWSQWLVVRQVVGESVAIAAVGGLLGVGLGVLAALAVDAFGPTLDASTTTGGGDGLFGLGDALSRTTSTAVSLDAPITFSLLLLGFGLAIAGGLVAGTAGALRANRLRPADALRQVE